MPETWRSARDRNKSRLIRCFRVEKHLENPKHIPSILVSDNAESGIVQGRGDIYLHIRQDEAGNWTAVPDPYLEIRKEIRRMATALEALTAEVARQNTVEKSALALIQGFKAQLDAAIAAGDPTALTMLSASLKESDDELAAAVAANTPPPLA